VVPKAKGESMPVGTPWPHPAEGAGAGTKARFQFWRTEPRRVRPISLLVTFPFVLFARKTMPPQHLNELLAWLKANPNRASAGTFAADQRLLSCWA